MAYDEELAERIRGALTDRDDVTERRMFGGIAFMVGGNMAVGVVKDELMVRVGREGHDAAMAQAHVRAMDFTNRPMAGFIYVAPEGVRSDDDLRRWVDAGASFATSLPPR